MHVNTVFSGAVFRDFASWIGNLNKRLPRNIWNHICIVRVHNPRQTSRQSLKMCAEGSSYFVRLFRAWSAELRPWSWLKQRMKSVFLAIVGYLLFPTCHGIVLSVVWAIYIYNIINKMDTRIDLHIYPFLQDSYKPRSFQRRWSLCRWCRVIILDCRILHYSSIWEEKKTSFH